MAQLILVTGGCRSGKSAYAQQRAEKLPGARTYVATCAVGDAEMRDRVQRHQLERAGHGWQTHEETIDLAAALASCAHVQTLLIDCLTLWVSNLLFAHEQQYQQLLREDQLQAPVAAFLAACQRHPGTVIAVTNEVGLGIVPENAVARRFRDLAGRCNQLVAAAADEVILLVSGRPLALPRQ